MRDQNAAKLLAKVMGWEDLEVVSQILPTLQLMADFKYDRYQQFGPGRRFIESLALWLHQFQPDHRQGVQPVLRACYAARGSLKSGSLAADPG